MKERLERQLEFDQRVVSALISATPETSRSFEMDVERQQEGKYESMLMCISNPEDRAGTVCPTDEVFEALYEHMDFFEQHGRVWQKLHFKVALIEAADWRYHIDFTY